MNTLSVNNLKSFLIIIAICQVLIAQTTNDDTERTRANEIIKDYHKAIKYEKPEKMPENLTIKYKQIWKVSNSDASSNRSLHSSGILLKSEDSNSLGNANYSRIVVLNENSFYREYSTPKTGKDVKKIDLSKTENKNDSEIRILKREAFTMLFPIILNAPWYKTVDLKYIGIAEAGDKKAFVLEGDRGSNTNIKLLFDTTSKLLIMWKFSTTSMDGKVNTYDYYLSNYKAFPGGKIPSLIEVYENQKFMERFEITDFQSNVKFDPKFFETQNK